MDFYKVLSIISPFISAFLAGFLTYSFTLKSKRFDILYQNKIPAFKEIVAKLISFKTFCLGRSAYYEGNEYSPYYEREIGAFNHRDEIVRTVELNSIFLSANSRKVINDLLNQMSGLFSAEIALAGGQDIPGIEKEYGRFAALTENCIVRLYNELNLLETK